MVTFFGGDGDDELIGSSGADTLQGIGKDIIYGDEAGSLYGTADSGQLGDGDMIYGGAGDDLIYGQYGDDVIFGDDGVDIIYGQDGDDQLNAGSGRDELYGGEGRDSLMVVSVVNLLVGGDDQDAVLGGYGSDTIRWVVGDDIDTVDGGGGNSDVLTSTRLNLSVVQRRKTLSKSSAVPKTALSSTGVMRSLNR